jgi:hypothetical protein
VKMNGAIAILGLIATVVAAFAAVAAWLTARTSNRTARSLADLERQRRQAELIPQFVFGLKRTPDGGIAISPKLVGPPALDKLDRLTVTVRDDTLDHSNNLAGGPTPEQIAAQVWGPYRFIGGADGAPANGRSVAPIPLLLGDDRVFNLEKTRPPSWSADTGQWWTGLYGEAPVRLTLLCERDGYEPWTVPAEVEIPAGMRREVGDPE